MKKLKINGEDLTFKGNKLSELLEALHINPRNVIIEKNLEIIPRDSDCDLYDGDVLEILKFMGGG